MIDARKFIEERRNVLESLKAPTRKLGKEVNDVQRELNRMLNRKKTVPDEEDLLRLVKMFSEISESMTVPLKILKEGYPR